MPPAPDNMALLVLAAGASSRMQGRDKLLENVAGQALLAHVVDIAIATDRPVFVTLPVGEKDRRNVITDKAVQIIEVPDAATGMSASLRAWVNSNPSSNHNVMVLLADMPDITVADLMSLLSVFASNQQAKIVRATSADGTPGHPVIFPQRLIKRFALLTGDQGARSILTNENIVSVPLPNSHATTDLDTPEQWADWRKAQHHLAR